MKDNITDEEIKELGFKDRDDYELSINTWKLDDELCRFFEGKENADFDDLYGSLKRKRDEHGDKVFMCCFWNLISCSLSVIGFISLCDIRLLRKTLSSPDSYFAGMDKKSLKLFKKMINRIHTIQVEAHDKKPKEKNA